MEGGRRKARRWQHTLSHFRLRTSDFVLPQISITFRIKFKPMERGISFSILLVSATLLFTAGKCDKNKYEYTESSVIEIARTPCFGHCPAYNFSIKGNGEASYEGKHFVELEGKHSRTFPADTVNAIFNTFVEADLWQYKNEYVEEVTDLPTTYLSFSHNGKIKKIKMYYGYPKELDNLANKLQELAFSQGWQ